jgi:acyl dehydratase
MTKLTEYGQVCGFPRLDPLPATYPHIVAFPAMLRLMRRRDFPLPLIGLVHIANVIEQHQPLSTVDNLDLAVAWENLRDHGRGRAVDVVAQATVDGQVVWRERSTYLRRAGRSRGPRPTTPTAIPTPRETWTVEAPTARAYARVSGDRNPIHTSTIAARLFGFPGRIAHGMWSKARCLAAFADDLPPAYRVEVAFKLPVVLPARVALSGDPGGFELRDAATGRPHLTGQVVSRPPQV